MDRPHAWVSGKLCDPCETAMKEREHYRPASKVGMTCDCCTVDVGYPEIPRLVQLPSGDELEVCGSCARAISKGDYSTLPEVSQL